MFVRWVLVVFGFNLDDVVIDIVLGMILLMWVVMSG